MKVTIEGQVYAFDSSQVRNKALIDIERVTGMTAPEWEAACGRGSALALTALVWLVRRQNGENDLAFEDIDFDLREVEMDDSDEEPGKDPETEEESPTN